MRDRRRRAPPASPARACRTVARVSSRLAMLAQQMRSTRPTTPRNSIEVRRSSRPITASCSGSIVTLRPAFVAGTPCQCRGDRAMSSAAVSRATPGLSRPMAWANAARPAPRRRGRRKPIRSTAPTCWLDRSPAPRSARRRPPCTGRRPTAACARRCAGSALKRVRQNPSLRITTFARSASSEGRNVRPAIGRRRARRRCRS